MTEDNKDSNPSTNTEAQISQTDAQALASASETTPEPNTDTESTAAEATPTQEIPIDTINKALPTKTKRFSWGILLLTILLLLTMAVTGGIAWRGYEYIQLDQEKIQRINVLENNIKQQTQQLLAVQQQRAQQQAQSNQQVANAKERLQALEQRVVAQNRRLLAMSTITREDWLLAEAEYLLKLANQRILIERSVVGAESLLTEADRILKDLADPDLFPLRKAVNNDLAALRLTQKIDTEGLYLAINGLVNQLGKLPLQPTRQEVMARASSVEVAEPTVNAQVEKSAWVQLHNSFKQFLSGLSEYVRVRDHSVEAKALLAPDTAEYIQHNIRLILERAQLALLREQPAIYQQSLVEAEGYIARYYPESNAATAFRERLQQLAAKEIVVSLPDITPSLELLHSYIEQMHSLKGAQPAAGSAQ